MTRLWIFAGRDLRRMAADRRALVINLVLPLVLTSVMGLSFGGGVFGKKGISAIPVALVAGDMPDALRDRLLAGLEESGFFAPVWADSLQADTLVRAGDVAAAIVLPPRALQTFFSGDSLTVAVWKDPSSEVKAGIVQEIVQRGVLRVQAGEAAYRALWPEDYRPSAADSAALEDLFTGGFDSIWRNLREPERDDTPGRATEFLARQIDHQLALGRVLAKPGVELVVADKAPASEEDGRESNLFDYFLPSFAVFFLMFAVAAGARDLHRERARRTLQRQLLAPGSPWPVVAGKWVASVSQGVIMLSVLLVAGALLFRVNLGPDPWTLPVVVLLTCTAASGVFMLLAMLVPSEKVFDNLSTAVVLISAMLGGNFLPIDNMPGWTRAAGQFVFNYWANLSFTRVIGDNGSLGAITTPLTVLFVASVVLLAAIVLLFNARVRRGGWA
ncbi:MAG: ABC transporter permease [bacterium]|nr:ABC transporter permease [bacterium]